MQFRGPHPLAIGRIEMEQLILAATIGTLSLILGEWIVFRSK